MDDLKLYAERPHIKSIGDDLWETALQNYAHPEIQKKIRAAKGFDKIAPTSYEYPPRDASRNINVIRENIIHFLIREAARYLKQRSDGKISETDIVNLLTTDKFSIDRTTMVSYLEKYPYLVEYYALFRATHEEINKRYGEALLELWQIHQRKPRVTEIADKMGLTTQTVSEKLNTKSRDKNPEWLLQLYEKGPSTKPNGKPK